jgi:hypothetical protein
MMFEKEFFIIFYQYFSIQNYDELFHASYFEIVRI